jgi:hypothetical protein
MKGTRPYLPGSVVERSGEVLVSRTVVDLVVGSDLKFVDPDEYELKGLPDKWWLFVVVG